MTEDVTTTKRKPLTPAERLKLYEENKGLCGICGLKIYAGEKWIDEHMKALGLGGSNDKGNRKPVHLRCAEVKTREEDMPRINKAKAQKKAHLGIKRESTRPMQSRGFPQGKTRQAKPMPARRPMYEEIR